MSTNEAGGPAADRIDDDLARDTRVVTAFYAALGRMREQIASTSQEADILARGLDRGVGRAIDGLLLDGGKLSDALRSIGMSLADTVYGIAMRPVQSALAGTLAAGLTGTVAPFAKGGAFSGGRVMAGGVVDGPTGFPMRGGRGLMGEAGPEAIMPLRRGPDGRLGVAATGGGAGGAVNVTFNIQTPDVAGFQRSQSQIAAQMSRVLARGERNS